MVNQIARIRRELMEDILKSDIPNDMGELRRLTRALGDGTDYSHLLDATNFYHGKKLVLHNEFALNSSYLYVGTNYSLSLNSTDSQGKVNEEAIVGFELVQYPRALRVKKVKANPNLKVIPIFLEKDLTESVIRLAQDLNLDQTQIEENSKHDIIAKRLGFKTGTVKGLWSLKI